MGEQDGHNLGSTNAHFRGLLMRVEQVSEGGPCYVFV